MVYTLGQDNDGLLERYKNRKTENLLELHNKTPVWNDGKHDLFHYIVYSTVRKLKGLEIAWMYLVSFDLWKSLMFWNFLWGMNCGQFQYENLSQTLWVTTCNVFLILKTKSLNHLFQLKKHYEWLCVIFIFNIENKITKPTFVFTLPWCTNYSKKPFSRLENAWSNCMWQKNHILGFWNIL